MNLLIFGPPGSGKGTQGKKIAQEYDLKHISFGDVLRDHVKNETEIGLKVKRAVENGALVGVEIMSLILQDQFDLLKSHSGLILDGFPRNLDQAKLLENLLQQNGMQVHGLIFLDVPTHISEQRMAERAKIEGRLDDQSPEKIAARLQIYRKETLPVHDFYKEKIRYHYIDGIQSLDDVYASIKDSLNSDF